MSKQHLIVLIIDDETHAAEAVSGDPMSRAELYRQGQFFNDDAAGMLGYEAWIVVHDAPEDLVQRLGELNVEAPA